MCQAIKDGGKRCPAQLSSSKQMISTVANNFPHLQRHIIEKVFCELVKNKNSITSHVVHGSNFEALTGTQLVADQELDPHVADAQNRLFAVTARINRTIESTLTDIASFSGYDKTVLWDEMSVHLSNSQKSEKYLETIQTSLRKLQANHLEEGELLSRSPEVQKHSVLGTKYLYHAPSGHLEIHHSFLGIRTEETQSYRAVSNEQWGNISRGEYVDLSGNLYADVYSESLHGKAYRCPHCGQFQALSHACPSRSNESPTALFQDASRKIAAKSSTEQNSKQDTVLFEEVRLERHMTHLREYLEEAGMNPDDAEKIESEHRENIAIRSRRWNQTIEDLANNKEKQEERLERIRSLAFQGFAVKKESPLIDDSNFTGGLCDVSDGGRGFGLEIEAAIPKSYFDSFNEKEIQTKVRIELYRRGITESIHEISSSVKSKSYSGWNVHQEELGLTEIVSPILSDTKQNWDEVQEVCEVLRGYGYSVSQKTGGHVNIDTSSFGKDRAVATELAQFNAENASFVNSFSMGNDSAGWRGNKYSGALNENLRITNQPMKFEQIVSNGKNKSVNLQSLIDDEDIENTKEDSRARAEYRNFNGTLNVEEWKHRVLLAAAITDFVQLKHSSYDDSWHDSYETYAKKNIADLESDSRFEQTPSIELRKIRDFITLLPISTERKQSLYSFARRDTGKKKWE